VVEVLDLLGCTAADRCEHRAEGGVVERRVPLEGAELAVESKDRRLADLEVDIAGAELDGAREQTVQIHANSNEGSAGGGPGFSPGRAGSRARGRRRASRRRR